jgi:hypothetical protein
MGRPPRPQVAVRKVIPLDPDVWDEVAEERKRAIGAVPSEADTIRSLIREALDHRYAAREPAKPTRKAPKP